MNHGSDAEILTALQRGIPLGPHPFELMAEDLVISENELLAKINLWIKENKIRRLGGIFDARRLGYRSVLCAIKATPERIDDIAARIVPHPGITHCYLRGWPESADRSLPGAPETTDDLPNLWFTFAVSGDEFKHQEQMLRESVAPAKIITLPAVRRFKIDVIFDIETRDRSETFPGAPASSTDESDSYDPAPILSDTEKKLINILSDNIPVAHSPFEEACRETGFSISEVISRLQNWQDSGIMRRMAVVLRHREVGFKANAMCTWHVSPEKALEKGRALASFSEVTHCYERDSVPGFPYNLFAMIHTGSWQDTSRLFRKLSDTAGLDNGRMLCSIKEYKKTSMNYFG